MSRKDTNQKYKLIKTKMGLLNIGTVMSAGVALTPLATGLIPTAYADDNPTTVQWVAKNQDQVKSAVQEQSKQNDRDDYVVQWGDTLSTIAQAYNTTVDDLVQAYGIHNPNLIFANHTLGQQAELNQGVIYRQGGGNTVAQPYAEPRDTSGRSAVVNGTVDPVKTGRQQLTSAQVHSQVSSTTPTNSSTTDNSTGSTNSSVTPDSQNPSSETPSSVAPNTQTPTSVAPNSTTPSSAAQDTQTPSSVTPSSTTPNIQTPTSITPGSTTPNSVAPDTQTPTSITPSSQTPSSVAPNTQMPTSVAPNSTMPSSVTPSSVTPGSKAPDTQTPTSVTPNSTAPSSVTPSSQTPDDSSAKAQSEAIAKSQAASQAVALSEAIAKSEAVVKSQLASEVLAKSEAIAKSQATSQAVAQSEAVAKSKAASEAVAQSEAIAKSQATSQAAAQSEAMAKSKAASEAAAQSEAVAKSQADSQVARESYLKSVATSLATPINASGTPPNDAVDISSHQGVISTDDFRKMKDQGVKVILVKLTESTSYKNPYAPQQIANAQAAGLQVGVYHYSWYEDSDTAKAEADYFTNYAHQLNLPANTVVINDLEQKETNTNDVTNNSRIFNDELKKDGYSNTMLYTAPFYVNVGHLNFDFIGNDRIWMATYPEYPTYNNLLHAQYGMWQWASNHFFDGVSGKFDVSVIYNPSIFNGSGIPTNGYGAI